MKIIVLNHKMNLLYEELDNYLSEIDKLKYNLIIAPSNIYLLEFLRKTHHQIASQDICYLEDGNYTGKVSWSQIKALGIKYSLIGHSEKNDNIDKINAKLLSCLSNNITPILCFGNQTKEESATTSLDKINYFDERIIYAYEPIFNISTNEIDIKYLEDKINQIHIYLLEKGIKKPTILYGGGINEKNITNIYHFDNLSGIILGAISSDIDKLKKILMKLDEK